MTTKTAYGNVYGIETMEEAERVIAKADAEREHEGCPECRGTLSLDACIDGVRAELGAFSDRRDSGRLTGNFTAREIALVARIDAWAALQPPVDDPLADTATAFGIA